MATEILTGPLGEWRAASTAGGGTALTTTAARIVLPFQTRVVQLTPRNFTTAVVVKYNLNPRLTVVKTTDALAALANATDYSDAAQDGSAATDVVLSSLDTAANNDYVFAGATVPFSGVAIDVDLANGNASVLTVEYWNGSAWTTTGATDGTIATGATMGQDGNVTWTVPTDWVGKTLFGSDTSTLKAKYTQFPLFWTRWSVSAALDASTSQNSWLAINRDTTYAEIPSGSEREFGVKCDDFDGVSSITALTDAGTANLIVNVATAQGSRF